jgi:hypothetical protein
MFALAANGRSIIQIRDHLRAKYPGKLAFVGWSRFGEQKWSCFAERRRNSTPTWGTFSVGYFATAGGGRQDRGVQRRSRDASGVGRGAHRV